MSHCGADQCMIGKDPKQRGVSKKREKKREKMEKRVKMKGLGEKRPPVRWTTEVTRADDLLDAKKKSLREFVTVNGTILPGKVTFRELSMYAISHAVPKGRVFLPYQDLITPFRGCSDSAILELYQHEHKLSSSPTGLTRLQMQHSLMLEFSSRLEVSEEGEEIRRSSTLKCLEWLRCNVGVGFFETEAKIYLSWAKSDAFGHGDSKILLDRVHWLRGLSGVSNIGEKIAAYLLKLPISFLMHRPDLVFWRHASLVSLDVTKELRNVFNEPEESFSVQPAFFENNHIDESDISCLRLPQQEALLNLRGNVANLPVAAGARQKEQSCYFKRILKVRKWLKHVIELSYSETSLDPSKIKRFPRSFEHSTPKQLSPSPLMVVLPNRCWKKLGYSSGPIFLWRTKTIACFNSLPHKSDSQPNGRRFKLEETLCRSFKAKVLPGCA